MIEIYTKDDTDMKVVHIHSDIENHLEAVNYIINAACSITGKNLLRYNMGNVFNPRLVIELSLEHEDFDKLTNKLEILKKKLDNNDANDND